MVRKKVWKRGGNCRGKRGGPYKGFEKKFRNQGNEKGVYTYLGKRAVLKEK